MRDPAELARLHAECFTTPRPWSQDEIAEILAQPTAFAIHRTGAFLIGRVIADEAELLTVAVSPALRRAGLGRQLVQAFLTTSASRGAATAFLEVAEDNGAAIGLYQTCGFGLAGRRKRYYRSPDGQVLDAIVMSRAI